jgi:acetyl-CoA C-acetyltransferase
MFDAYIYDAVRTPRGRGKASGSLHEVTPLQLASTVLRALRQRNHLEQASVDDIILGCVEPVGEQGANIARIAGLASGYAESTPGIQINRFCASGLEACNLAAAQIMAGQADLIVGGGVESMSRIPMMSSGGAWSVDPQIAIPTHFVPQGISADLIATKYGFRRRALDLYAVQSQHRAVKAWQEGRFARSIIPVKDINGLTLLERDEWLRPETTLESVEILDPSFRYLGENFGFDAVALHRYPEIERIDHVHHAANSSGLADGAAAVLIGSGSIKDQLGIRPRARIRAFASVGSEPCIMLTAPSMATEKALQRAHMNMSDIELIELNEAFASVVLLFMQQLNVQPDLINVNGGAIAMGHPLGATGAMILGTLLDELERTGKGIGLATLCVAAGMGTATIIERL